MTSPAQLPNWRLTSPAPPLESWHWSWDQIQEAQVLGQVWILTSPVQLLAIGVGRRAGSIFEILYLEVPFASRGQGWGSSFLKSWTLRMLKEDSEIEFFSLEVSDRNRAALSFYSNLGFELLHERKNYYRDSSSALVMELSKRKILAMTGTC